MVILRSLLPFILYAVLSSFTSELAAATAALALTVVLLVAARRGGAKADELVLQVSSLAFFAVYVVACVVFPHGEQGRWAGAAIQLWLGITVIVTILRGTPFTLPIARTEAPREFWASPAFLHFNVVISRAWAVSFLLSAALVGALDALHEPGYAGIVIMVAAIVVPVRYTTLRIKKVRTAAPHAHT